MSQPKTYFVTTTQLRRFKPDERTSVAEAVAAQRLFGTTKVVPFPTRAGLEFFRSRLSAVPSPTRAALRAS